MEIDEAHEVLDPDDIKEVVEQRKKSIRSQAVFEKFGNDLSEKTRACNGGRSGSASSGGAGNGRMKLSLPQTSRIPHSECKNFMCPGGQLWQSSNPGAWHSRVPPLKNNLGAGTSMGKKRPSTLWSSWPGSRIA